MKNLNFPIQPFPSDNPVPDLKITAGIDRHSNILAISYTILGSLKQLLIPELACMPLRKHKLWEETCFEFFIGLKNSNESSHSGKYWEFNISPAGHWNVYCFDSYRQNMQVVDSTLREETAFKSLPFEVLYQPDSLQIAAELDLNKIIPADKELKIAISAVIKSNDEKLSYWALKHPGSQPDFHHQDSFIADF
ncbi:MAG: DOMON-like domain-containing protein [Nitrospirota bacterium]